MSIDWFTVAAQIVNFLILVWLLKKFLYKPVLTAMDNRQQKVKAELEQAAALALTAEKERKQYLALQEEAREQGDEALRQAHLDADCLRHNLFQEIEAEAEKARVHQQQELARGQALFLKQASAQVADHFHRLAQNVFRDLADEDLEESIVARFCGLIANQDLKQDFFHQLKNSGEIQVSTGFGLSWRAQEALLEVLRLRIGGQPEISFEQEPSLLAGILLSSDDHKLEWNIHQYLDDFQDELKKAISKDK